MDHQQYEDMVGSNARRYQPGLRHTNLSHEIYKGDTRRSKQMLKVSIILGIIIISTLIITSWTIYALS